MNPPVTSFLSPNVFYSRMIKGLAPILLAGQSFAAVTIVVSDRQPGDANRSLQVTSGVGAVVGNNSNLPNLSYTLSGVNLTSLGGVANHTIVFTAAFDSPEGPLNYNGNGHIGVVGGTGGGSEGNRVNDNETLTGIFSLSSISDGFDPNKINVGATRMVFRNVNGGESFDIATSSQSFTASSEEFGITSSSFFTISNATEDGVNLRGFDITITAVPETSSVVAGLLIFSGLITNRRRAKI